MINEGVPMISAPFLYQGVLMTDFDGQLLPESIRADFPILHQEHHSGVPLIYLDNAASSQKPLKVIEALDDYYRGYNANVHRGIHKLSEAATQAYEGARIKLKNFIHAKNRREIIYTRGTTESINLVANTWGRANLKTGDVVVSTQMEHHSNIVPWQILAAEKGFTVRYIPVLPNGTLDMDAYAALLRDEPVKLVTVMHVSNVLGTVNPIAEIVRQAHAAGALVLVDGAQSVPHMAVDVQALDVDFFAFSGHKMVGPTGIGVLYGKRDLLEAMPPWMGGGDMISRVTLDGSTWNDLPYKFEAGTPSIAEAIGLGYAVDYLTEVGIDKIHAHEHALTEYALERLAEVPGLTVYGPDASQKGAVAAFKFGDIHAHDVAQILDSHGIAVRAGHHCAMPLHDCLGANATARASFYLYNTPAEIDALIEGLYQVKKTFSRG
jgi:cysteine desulfurase/selenocysteine lyase